MRLLIAATFLLAWDVQGGMQHAFYPVLLLALVAGSLGVPIPEDVPLLAAGVILSQQPEIASWTGTLSIALLGIMCGDVVLFVLGKRWGPEVCQHRWVSWVITPHRLDKMTEKFNRYGMWMCFFGRFFMGVRAAMCITAGVTRLPFWRFLLADAAGAVISIPVLVGLGYWFASLIPTLKAYVHLVQWGLLGITVIVLAGFVAYRRRYRPRKPPALVRPAPSPQVTAQQSSRIEEVSPIEPTKRVLDHTKAKTCL